MGLIKHVNILTALEMRPLRYHNKGHTKSDQDKIMYNEAMDENGTIDTADISDFDSEPFNRNNFINGGNYGDSR